MSENNSFKSTVESLFSGMDSFLSSKTVVGEAINVGDTIILPLVDVSFGIGAGNFNNKEKGISDSGAGGMGAKMEPSAVVVISGSQIKLVNIKNQDSMTKILDMLPDFVDKVTKTVAKKRGKSVSVEDEEVRKEAGKELKEMLDESVNNV